MNGGAMQWRQFPAWARAHAATRARCVVDVDFRLLVLGAERDEREILKRRADAWAAARGLVDAEAAE